MIKRRPAIVLVGRLPHRDNLHTVVPLSGTASHASCEYHCRIELADPLPEPFPLREWWVKADMLATVGFARLELFRSERDRASGKRRYLHPKVTDEQFAAIRVAVMRALNLRG